MLNFRGLVFGNNGQDFGLQMEMICKGKQLLNMESDNIIIEEGQSSESNTNVYSCNSGPPEDDSSDTSLKLGWAKY